MKLGKKAKRGTRVKKLVNGGNGDPLAPLQPKKAQPVQSPAGFPLYREDGELTPTPSTPFYTKTNLRGLYEGVPLGLQEATVVGRPGDSLQSIDSAVESLGMGVFGDYAQVEPETRKKFEQGVTDAIGEGSKIAAIATSPLIAIGAGPLLGSGLSGYSQLANMPLVTAAGETTATVGNVVDALGVGLSAEFLPQHIKDFAENPSIGNAAFIGLDLLGFLPAGQSALASYKQSLGATKAVSPTPMQFPAVERNLVQTAVESAEVQNARLTMNTTIQNEVSKIEKLPITPEQKEKAIHETLEFYNEYLSAPEALEKLVEHKNFLSAASKAMKGDTGPLYQMGAPMPPFEGQGAAMTASRYIKNTPYFARFDDVGNPLTVMLEEPYLMRNMNIVEEADGALNVSFDTFTNTEQGRRLAAEALLDNFRSGSQSARNAVLRTVEQMKAAVGTTARGYATPVADVSNQAEMIGGRVSSIGDYGYDLTAQQIAMLNTLSPEEFVYTLVHETNHNMLIPFLNQTADMQIIEMHTINSTVNRPVMFSGFPVFPNQPASSMGPAFRNQTETLQGASEVVEKYLADGRVGADKRGIEIYLAEITKPTEVQARLMEMKKAYSNIAAKEGLSFSDWMYNFTPERARQAFEAWKSSKAAGSVGMGGVESEMFFDIFVGNTEQQKLQTLASVLNKTFFNPATIVGTGAVATQAAISGEEAPTINKRGGLVKKLVKKKRRGY